MTRLVGYTRKKEPRWFSVLLTGGIVILIVLVFLAVTFSINWTTALVKSGKTAARNRTVTTKAAATTVAPALAEVVQPVDEKVSVGGGEIKVEKIVLSSGITGNLPVDNLEKLSGGGRVYCYSRILTARIPRTIYHVWVGPEGKIAAEIKLTISRIPSDLWSYINLGGFSPGAWELQIKDEGGGLLGRKTFTVE